MSNVETLQPDRLGQQVGPRNSPLIKSNSPLVVWDLPNEDNTEQLVDDLVTIILAQGALREYNGLPKTNSRERQIVDGLVTKTASELLQNPQNIRIEEEAWKTNEAEQDGSQEPQEPFSKTVKEKMLTLIKDKWGDVTPEQLAQLIRIYASKDVCQESARQSAKDLLRNYFKGPRSRSQRIDAYYNFVSGVLDLAGEDEAFREGMKIALHATDILPKNPSLIEQTGLLSLPYGEVESVFKKLLIARSVIARVRFMGSWDIDKYYEDRGNFIITDSVAIEGGDKRKGKVIRKIGANETREMYDRMKATMGFIASGSIESLSEERKQSLMKDWPFNLVLDETDPLNQKFEKVFSENRSNSAARVELGLV